MYLDERNFAVIRCVYTDLINIFVYVYMWLKHLIHYLYRIKVFRKIIMIN